MRIVAIADTHTFEEDLGVLPPGDVLIHGGDLCRAGTLDELEPVVAWLRGQPHAEKIVVAGNHDWCFVRELAEVRTLLGPGIRYLQDEELVIGGLRFWGSPWQPEFAGWAFNLPRGEALARRWALIPDAVDVLITHGPPQGFGDCTAYSQGRLGCEELRAALDRVRPRLHIFGHIHDSGGVWEHEEMVLANVSTWECERGASIFDIDPITGQVTVVHVPPSGSLER